MKDPHVEVLYYEFVSLDDRHDFSHAATWRGNLGGFHCQLADGQLEARPQVHYPNTQSAREALDPHLRAWEFWSELNDGIRIGFRPGAARVVDRASAVAAVEVQTASVGVIANDATVKLGHGFYPAPPPNDVSVSSLVSELMGWVRDLRERRHPMLFIAYLFLSRLEYEYQASPGRSKLDKIAKALHVSNPVLHKLGELSTKNDPDERRKVTQPPDPLTDAERQWILAVLPRLTRQAATIAAGSIPSQLTMADPDLPPL